MTDAKPMTGLLPEPIRSWHDEPPQWSWIRCGRVVSDWALCAVNPDTFASLVHNAHLHGGESGGGEISYPTRNLALRAGEYAGLLIAEWQYDHG